jgi:hypothetical protein
VKTALGLMLIVALAGCTTRIGDLTVASPKNVPVTFDVVKKGIEGKDCAYQLLSLIPIGTLNPTMDGALDEALAKVEDADALTDASFYNDILITLIFNSNCIRVEGTAIRTR